MDKILVNKIIGTPVNGRTRVSVEFNQFAALAQKTPSLEYKTVWSKGKDYVREFIIGGISLYAWYTNSTRATVLLMNTEDATRLQQEALAEIKEEGDASFLGLAEFAAQPAYTAPAVA